MSPPASVRIAVLDSDTGFLQVLAKRLDGMGWQYRVLASPVPLDAVVAMRLNAMVIDLAVLGRPAGARAAARRRRLGDQALPSRGADRPRGGRRTAAQAQRGSAGRGIHG